MIGIYGIKNKTNDKIYVGKSIQIQVRLARHKSDLKKNKHFNRHLQSAYNKYGDDSFEFVVLEETQTATAEEMVAKEQYWVDYHLKATGVYNKSLDVSLRPGDSFLGKEHSLTTKEKMSIAKKGKFLGKDNPNFGKRWTSEKKRECALSHPRTKLNESNVIEIVNLLKNGLLSDAEIADKFKVGRTVITRIANGTRWSHITGGNVMDERRGVRNIGKSRSENTKQKIRYAITGIKRSDETKRKISESKIGKKHKEE